MRHIKKQEEFVAINEMAKGFPPGTIIKVTNPKQLGYSQYNDWRTFDPKQAKGADGGLFYMLVKDSGRKWLEGPIIYSNCLTNSDISSYKGRVATTSAESPGDEYRIFKKNEALISAVMKKSFFLDGSETGIMSNDGKTTSISEAEYSASGVNFKLTDLYDEPVIFFMKKAGGKSGTPDGFSIKLSDINSLTKELSDDHKTVIAEWFSKELKEEIEIQGDKFRIMHYKIVTTDTGSYPASFSAGPFTNEEQANKILDILKKETVTLFSPTNLKVQQESYSRSNLNLEEMINYAKTVGITTTMKQLIALKKGAIAGKKFGI